jgi:cell pole-organizing protein PopZ
MGQAMAEQAQKEPTMEEILSSIRKIIADDDTPQQATEAAAEVDDLSVFEDDGPEPEPMESEEDVLAAISQSMDEVAEELEADAPAEDDSFDFVVEEDNFESFEEDQFEGVEEFVEAEVELEPVEDSFDPAPEPEVKEEVPMTATAAPLTDTATVTAAAGALGKLLANVEFGEDAGGATTIEGLVREMLRPMLKEWLDENLPGIVEKHVEAEVQRIARMAG